MAGAWFYFLADPMFYALDFFFKLMAILTSPVLIVTFFMDSCLFPLHEQNPMCQ